MVVLIGLTFGSPHLFAAEKSDTASFWAKLRIKLESLTPQTKITATHATAGIRGAPMSSEDLYWKDDVSAQTVEAEELETFKKAVALIDLADKSQAQIAFEEFIKKYPESSLRKDADQALALCKP